jgi:hypothetical protein
MMAAFGVRWKYSMSLLAAGWWSAVRDS